MWRAAFEARRADDVTTPSPDERRYLNRAIEQYTLGMELDYNRYFCSNNLPALLRARGGSGDAERAAVVDQFVVAACERAIKRGDGDDWLRATLLGAAFRAGDVAKTEELAAKVEDEGAAAWKLDPTLKDTRIAVAQLKDAEVQASLLAIIERLTPGTVTPAEKPK